MSDINFFYHIVNAYRVLHPHVFSHTHLELFVCNTASSLQRAAIEMELQHFRLGELRGPLPSASGPAATTPGPDDVLEVLSSTDGSDDVLFCGELRHQVLACCFAILQDNKAGTLYS